MCSNRLLAHLKDFLYKMYINYHFLRLLITTYEYDFMDWGQLPFIFYFAIAKQRQWKKNFISLREAPLITLFYDDEYS